MLDNRIFSRDKFHILDGAMGTMLQKAGLKLGQIPETLSIENPEIITQIHKSYIASGSELIYANTFGANSHKLKNCKYSTKEIITASITCAKNACCGKNVKVALDVGPLGALLEPSGTMSFDEAYSLFAEMVENATNADLIVFETFTDLYELKAAILAAKEHSNLPIMCSMSFESNGRTFTGCTIESFASLAVNLGVDAVGINCSLGPNEILPFAKQLCDATPFNFPIFVKPNAGLPRADGSGYDLDAVDFAKIIELYKGLGIVAVGGCCGTTPDFIKNIAQVLSNDNPCDKPSSNISYICSPTRAEAVSNITIVGERINPTGKKRFQQALRENDIDYILSQAIEQANGGAQILDVNVGIPDIDETQMLSSIVKNIQSVIDLPLQIDSSSPEAIEKALRYYNGTPIVNSVNGEEKSLERILPLCKKYGALVIGLTLDEKGIPETALGRFAIAKKIVERAEEIGISRNKVYIDCLTMTISSNQNNAKITLDALKMVKEQLGCKTALGVSNISFGLPLRNNVNSAFLTLAMNNGLDLAIVNPNAEEIMSQIFAYRALTGIDENCINYIARYKNAVQGSSISISSVVASSCNDSLVDYIINGLKGKSAEKTRELLKTLSPLEIIDNHLIKALDIVGNDYEVGKAYLPELLQSASAAQSAFEVLKEFMCKNEIVSQEKGKVILATVKGDIHDIGKNIVKVVLENYGYSVIDLGRDVSPQLILENAKAHNVKLVGLSALMTTTVKSMAETIALLNKELPNCKTMVGGAVLTPEYAKKINADFYCKDAKQSADTVKNFFATTKN